MTARTLTDEQLSQLKSLFSDALDLPLEQRTEFILDSTNSDPLLRNELASLLEAHQHSDHYFETIAETVIAPAVASLDALSLGSSESAPRVAHYELMEKIGGGGMGVVYKAQDSKLGRLVALKFLPTHHASNPSARANLIAEARAASRLDHPNIGTVYEIGQSDDGQQFIAMAWYDGETLKAKIRRERLSVPASIDIALQLSSALTAAHRAGIIHRDVKPANVLVTSSGTVKLVDFGIAKLMSDEDGARHPQAGTLAYMSPEQLDDIAIDARTDIWSLGILLYESLAGQRPFRGESEKELISAIRSQDPPRLSTIRSDISLSLERIISRCFARKPADRYQSAIEFSEDLRRLGNEASGSPVRTSSRKRAAFAALAIVAIVGAAVTLWKVTEKSKEKTAFPILHPVSVAVLPLRSVGNDTSTAYLADAIAEDLRSDLRRIASLTVPSYISTQKYAGSAKPIEAVAKELNAGFIVSGDVGRDVDGYQLDIRLLDVSTHKVQKFPAYSGASANEVDIVRRAARDIVTSLLSNRDQQAVSGARTTNRAAYESYLRGMSVWLAGSPKRVNDFPSVESIRQSQSLYAQARSLDPDFAANRAQLAMTHISSAVAYDTTHARLDQARIEAETALRLDSMLPDAHIALASYLAMTGSLPKAVDELEREMRSQPGEATVSVELGKLYIRSGRWEDAIGAFRRAHELDPRNLASLLLLATANGRLRHYDQGVKALNALLDMSPDEQEAKLIKGQMYLRWKGSADTLLALLDRLPRGWDGRGMATFARYTALRAQRRYVDALKALDKTKATVSRDGVVYYPVSLMRAELHHALGEERVALTEYEDARRLLADSASVHPTDPAIHSSLALALAGLRKNQEAVKEAQTAMDLAPIGRSAGAATAVMGPAVEVFARVGNFNRAFEIAELLLTLPAGREMSVAFLQAWPGYAPLKSDPRFDVLIRRFTPR